MLGKSKHGMKIIGICNEDIEQAYCCKREYPITESFLSSASKTLSSPFFLFFSLSFSFWLCDPLLSSTTSTIERIIQSSSSKSFRDRGCTFDPILIVILDVRKLIQGRRFCPAFGRTLAQSSARSGLLLVMKILLLLCLLLLLLLARRGRWRRGGGRRP